MESSGPSGQNRQPQPAKLGPDQCPKCKASDRYLEKIGHGWWFCNGCAQTFFQGATGNDRRMA